MELSQPSSSSPYTPVGGSNAAPQNPAIPGLGPVAPNVTSSAAPQTGLSVTRNPEPQPFQSQQTGQAQGGGHSLVSPSEAAQQTQSYGRGNDSVLIHMTPEEVNSLRGLAQRFGGDLTTNPHTGLPEAGWLGKLLPTLLGGALSFIPGIGPLAAAGIVGLGDTAITGDLRSGLMAGLGAFGGASLGSALGAGNVFGSAASKAASAAGTAANAASAVPATNFLAAPTAGQIGAQSAQLAAEHAGLSGLANSAAPMANMLAAPSAGQIAAQSAQLAAQPGVATLAKPGFMTAFKNAATIPGIGKIGATVGPALAAQGILGGVAGAANSMGTVKNSDGSIDNSYQGPYYAQARHATFAPSTDDITGSSKERTYFDVSQPEIYNAQGQVVQPGSNTAPGTPIVTPVLNPNAGKGKNMYSFTTQPWMANNVNPNQPTQPTHGTMLDVMRALGLNPTQGYAEGGTVDMDEGGFVVPARAVAEVGNGYTDAGFERLRKLGGVPIRGPGDGVSDDIPAKIGDQEARVAAGEVYMPPHAVQRAGGAKKLYALVNKAHEARKRGENSPVAKGLDAL